jgi:glycosyltransferase involved in cell wall biosynthesis
VLAEFHNISQFSVLPSRDEGFAVAALEAMGCGLPVVATDIPSLSELIVGKTVPIGDARALAEAMESMLDLAADDKKRLSDRALNKALGYSWKKNTEIRMGHYISVIESGSFR